MIFCQYINRNGKYLYSFMIIALGGPITFNRNADVNPSRDPEPLTASTNENHSFGLNSRGKNCPTSLLQVENSSAF